MEIWKKYENSIYEVSTYGRVRSTRNGSVLILKPQKTDKGYVKVPLSKIGKPFIHRLVGKLFVPNPNNKPYINHLNAIKDDNRVENLEWVTHGENNTHAQGLGLGTGCIPCVVINFDNQIVSHYDSRQKAYSYAKNKKGFIVVPTDKYTKEYGNELIQKKLAPRKCKRVNPNPNRQLNHDQVSLIRELHLDRGYIVARIARIFVCDPSVVRGIITGKFYSDYAQKAS